MRSLLKTLYVLLTLFVAFTLYWSYDYFFLDDINQIPVLDFGSQPVDQGYVCIGFNDFGNGSTWGGIADECPKGYAYLATNNGGGDHKEGPGNYVNIYGHCCKLPFDDILTEEHTYQVLETCPDNSVMTGGTGDDCGEYCGARCTRINTEKYKLGTEYQSAYWRRRDIYAQSGRGGALKLFHVNIPAAIRYAIGRPIYDKRGADGCVGIPFGSLLVRKATKRCDGFYYRPLLFLDGTPVRMFPECDDIDDPFDPDAKCVRR